MSSQWNPIKRSAEYYKWKPITIPNGTAQWLEWVIIAVIDAHWESPAQAIIKIIAPSIEVQKHAENKTFGDILLQEQKEDETNEWDNSFDELDPSPDQIRKHQLQPASLEIWKVFTYNDNGIPQIRVAYNISDLFDDKENNNEEKAYITFINTIIGILAMWLLQNSDHGKKITIGIVDGEIIVE